jgi:heme-degrading monooxygenase HmoA
VQHSSGEAGVELATFKTKEGVTQEQFLATVDAVSEWVKRQPGFISYDLAYAEETDTWMEVIWWESLDAARYGAEAAVTSESCAPMFALIDRQSTRILHGERVIPTVAREVQNEG